MYEMTLWHWHVSLCYRVKELRECEEAVYAGSIASSGQPVLSPAPVVDAISQLGTMLHKLEQVSVDIIKVANEHKQVGGDWEMSKVLKWA